MVNFRLPFIKISRYAAVPLALLLVSSLLTLGFLGLNMGKDFSGGLIMELRSEQEIPLASLRQDFADAGLKQVDLKRFGDDFTLLVTVTAVSEDNTELVAQIRELLDKKLAGAEYRRVDLIGPEVSRDLANNSLTAVVLAVLVMLFYIWLRFEWQFSLGAVLALIHDLILTLGFFSVFQLEFGIPSIAAILTIMGYSVNDTVVVYDRIRDNLRLYKRQPLATLLDRSVNETFKRTLITSLTTLFALLAMFFLGGEFLRNLCLPLLWGVLVGTFSSILIAAPVLLYTGVPREEL